MISEIHMATLHFLNPFLLGPILGQEFDITSSSYVTLEMGGLVHCVLGNTAHFSTCSIGFAMHTKNVHIITNMVQKWSF